ncbi:MAG: hypothetical protein H6756_11775 [Candidatus Omnitrophica bacterium]|nr:hypothetical protein [Candidatus Omnitrophota bacterium]
MDKMVGAGIRGILNFAPVVLKAPEEVFVDSINLVLELETVNYFAQAYAGTNKYQMGNTSNGGWQHDPSGCR